MVPPEMYRDHAGMHGQLQASLEAVHCLWSKFLNKTQRNFISQFGKNRISKQKKKLHCPVIFSVVMSLWEMLPQ